MKMLTTLVILCAFVCMMCAHGDLNDDLGIAAYKRGHYQAAFYDFETRARKGDRVAQFCLGYMYKHERGVAVDDEKAKEWYELAAAQGYPPAQNNLGVMHVRLYEESERKTTEVLEIARGWFEKAASQGYPPAQYNLAIIAEQSEDSFALCEKAAKRGYAPAQDFLGEMYYYGEGVNQDLKASANWYQEAAEQGYAPAQTSLGICYTQGKGRAKNPEEARKWYAKAAEQGYADGQDSLGLYYYLDGNKNQAKHWYIKAAEQGVPEAQNNLAVIYTAEARRLDDEKKHEKAKKRYEKAARWYFSAAQQGYAIAQANIGKKFDRGQDGVPQDSREAYIWCSLALKDEATLRLADKDLVSEATAIRDRIGKSLKNKDFIDQQVDKWQSKQQRVSGTGFYVDEHHILTNAHVVISNWEQASSGEDPVFFDEFRIPYLSVKPKAVDVGRDLALLYHERGNTKKDENGKPITATIRQMPIEVGENISVFGYPQSHRLSYAGNLTPGIVSALSYPIGYSRPEDGFQHTAPTQGGNSGGPVLDAEGRVIGVSVEILYDLYKPGYTSSLIGDIPVFIDIAQNLNFAIHFEVVDVFLKNNGIGVVVYSKKELDRLREEFERAQAGFGGATTERTTTEPLKEIPLGTLKSEAKMFTRPVVCYKIKTYPPPMSVKEIDIESVPHSMESQ